MKILTISIGLLSLILLAGCKSGAGKQIVKGAVRGGTHGVIEQNIGSEVGKGAAHGALNSTYQVRDQNKARRKTEDTSED